MHLFVCAHVCAIPCRGGKKAAGPRSWSQGGSELPDMGAGVEIRFLQSRPLLTAESSPQPQRYLANSTLNMYKGCQALMLAARSKSVALHYAGSAGLCLYHEPVQGSASAHDVTLLYSSTPVLVKLLLALLRNS